MPTDASGMTFDKFNKELTMDIDIEGKYNTKHVNNQEALGYDNFEKRLQDADKNRDLAHETFFDKLLADYFL